MEKKEIVIGYAPTRRNVFSVSAAIDFKSRTLEKIKTLTNAKIIDIEDVNSEGILFSDKDLSAIIDKFKRADIDGLFCPHCNFGTEDLVCKLAKALGKPLLIWGPRDESPLPDGVRERDSQCGLFATGKVLRRFGVPFTYLPNDTLDSTSFTRGYKGFVAVCGIVSSFQSIKILQIAPRPSDFWTMIINEGELLEKFGIEVFPVNLEAVTMRMAEIIKENPIEYVSILESIKNSLDCTKIEEEAVKNVAALKYAISLIVEENNCTAVSVQCWNDMQKLIGIMPCIVNGIFCEEGIPMVCETDIHGAITSIILQEAAMRTSPIFFADLTVRHPTDNNAELLWHCGNFPQSLAKDQDKMEMASHFIIPTHCPGTGNWELKSGDLTICRFDGDNGKYSLFIGEGKTCEGPFSLGTYVWMKVNDWLMWEKKLVEGPYVHHCAGVHAHIAPILSEACKYIPHLEADLMDPTESEVMQWWLGR